MAKKGNTGRTIIAQNRKARFNYHIKETLEAGLVLWGSEVKSLRSGRANIAEAYAGEKDGELYLINSHINEYKQSNRFNHEPRRMRKLLLKRKQIDKLLGAIQQKGVTLVPLTLYFNEKGFVKLELGIAEGKKQHDKRATIKEREWQRDKARALKDY